MIRNLYFYRSKFTVKSTNNINHDYFYRVRFTHFLSLLVRSLFQITNIKCFKKFFHIVFVVSFSIGKGSGQLYQKENSFFFYMHAQG